MNFMDINSDLRRFFRFAKDFPGRAWRSAKIRLWHFFSPSRRLSQVQRIQVKALARRTLSTQIEKPIREDFVLLSMTGARHLEYLVESLHSLCSNWTSVPHVKIVTDGSVTPETVAGALIFYPVPVIVENYESVVARFNEASGAKVLQFANRHVLGRKLLVILAHSSDAKPHLWTDADILWFRDLPAESLQAAIGAGLALASDVFPSYDTRLQILRPLLKIPPYYNSGLVMVAHLSPLPIDEIQDMLNLAIDQPSHFSEQTILAALAIKRGGPAWPLDEVFISNEDEHRIPLHPTFAKRPWTARHYATAMKQFWRDALHLRRNA